MQKYPQYGASVTIAQSAHEGEDDHEQDDSVVDHSQDWEVVSNEVNDTAEGVNDVLWVESWLELGLEGLSDCVCSFNKTSGSYVVLNKHGNNK